MVGRGKEGRVAGRSKVGGQAWGHHLSAACLVFPFGLPWGGACASTQME